MTVARTLIIGLIQIYQTLLSPLLGPKCRFHPTCSAYMSEAITQHGILHGAWFGICRLSRCHPWREGGFDPVPKPKIRTTDRCCFSANTKCEP